MNEYVLGIDPGYGGAIAVVQVSNLNIIYLADMPVIRYRSASRKSGYKTRIDVVGVRAMLDPYRDQIGVCGLENPGPRPKQGLGSTYDFAKGCGQIHGVMVGLEIVVQECNPTGWKLALGLSYKKEDSIKLANEVFPMYAKLWKLKKDNDRAEAALLAYFIIKNLRKV